MHWRVESTTQCHKLVFIGNHCAYYNSSFPSLFFGAKTKKGAFASHKYQGVIGLLYLVNYPSSLKLLHKKKKKKTFSSFSFCFIVIAYYRSFSLLSLLYILYIFFNNGQYHIIISIINWRSYTTVFLCYHHQQRKPSASTTLSNRHIDHHHQQSVLNNT